MKYLMYSQNDVMSTTSPEQDAEQYFFWGPNTRTSVPDSCAAKTDAHGLYAVVLLALPPANTTSQFRCIPRTQHFLVDQENLEGGMITSLLQLLVQQLHIWKMLAWTWILHT